MILMTIADAAKAIKMSEGFIRVAIRNGELKAVRFGKKRGVRIKPEHLSEFIDGRIAGTSLLYDADIAALRKMAFHLNQRDTDRD